MPSTIYSQIPLRANGDTILAEWFNTIRTQLINNDAVKNNIDATAAPTVNDDENLFYDAGSKWVDVNNQEIYECLDNSSGAAVWVKMLYDGSSLDAGDLSGAVGIENGGTGQTTRQAAIDALTDVSSATTGYVLTKDGSGNATFQVASSGGGNKTVVSLSSGATLGVSDDIALCDGSGGAFAVGLPSASSGKIYEITKTDTSFNAITITGLTTLDTYLETIRIVYDGSSWVILTRDYDKSEQSYIPSINGSTTNPTKGTRSVDRIVWYRDGLYLIGRYEYIQTTAGSNGAGNYYLSMPSGLSIDTTNITNSTGLQTTSVGSGFISGATNGLGSTTKLVNVHVFNSSGISVIAHNASTNENMDFWSDTLFGLGGTNRRVGLNFKVPISGWN